jgi:surface protein
MSLLSNVEKNVVKGSVVQADTFIINQFAATTLNLPALNVKNLEIGSNNLNIASEALNVTTDNADIVGNVQITGALVIQTGVTTVSVVLPDIGGNDHLLSFQNGLLKTYKRSSDAFVFTINTNLSANPNSFTLPLVSSGTYNMAVFWGDGSASEITQWNDTATTHSYSTPGVYTIQIFGQCEGWVFYGNNDGQKLTGISQWGPDFRFGNSNLGYFINCTNFSQITAPDVPNLTGTTNLTNMFANCGNLQTSNLNTWNVSQVLYMDYMFLSCLNFNGNLGSWDVSNVLSMANMFATASSFNNGGSDTIKNWHAPKCQNFAGFVYNCGNFNQPLTNLVDTASLAPLGLFCDVQQMFYNCFNFNGDLSNWNTSRAINMFGVFYNCTTFNRNVGHFDVSSCKTFDYMFYNCTSFNNGGSNTIKNWKTGQAETMSRMFFLATSFNQPLEADANGAWNVYKVTTFESMFQGAASFNQYIGNWVINFAPSAQVSMRKMFYEAYKFNNGDITTMANVNPSQASYNASTRTVSCTGATFLSTLTAGDTVWIVTVFDYFIATVQNVTNDTQFVTTTDFATFNIGTNQIVNIQKASISYPTAYLRWNFSNVTDTLYMFYNAQLFNQYVGNPFTPPIIFSKAQTFNGMFQNAYSFNNGDLPGGSLLPLSWITSSQLTDVQFMFYNCYAFNSPMTSSSFPPFGTYWNVSGVIYFNNMFFKCYRFNQNIGSWVVTSGRSFTSMFENARAFNNGGSNLINNWTPYNMTSCSYMFQLAVNFNQPVNNLVNNIGYQVQQLNQMFYYAHKFNNGQNTTLTTVDPSLASYSNVTNVITLPGAALTSSIVNVGDKVVIVTAVKTYVNSVQAFTATSITLNGNLGTNFVAGNIFNISSYTNTLGNSPLQWRTNLVYDTSNLFTNCYNFNQYVSQNGLYWNTGNLQYTYNMFMSTYSFNNGDRVGETSKPLELNTSSMVNFAYMFFKAQVFNQTLQQPGTTNGWSSTNNSSLASMFEKASQFNNGQFTCISVILPYGATYTESTKTLVYPGAGFIALAPTSLTVVTKFGTFTRLVSSVVNDNTVVFVTAWGIGNLSFGDIINVINTLPAPKPFKMSTNVCQTVLSLFQEAELFNQPLLTDGTYWTNPIMTIMSTVFYKSYSFNQPMSQFFTKNATTMSYMFYEAAAFNQPLVTDEVNGYWDVQKVNNMLFMFNSAYSFKQDLASWKPYLCTNFVGFLNNMDINNPNSATNQNNYNSLLNSWGTAPRLASLKPSLTFGANQSKYTIGTAGAARTALLGKPWTINDNGGV